MGGVVQILFLVLALQNVQSKPCQVGKKRQKLVEGEMFSCTCSKSGEKGLTWLTPHGPKTGNSPLIFKQKIDRTYHLWHLHCNTSTGKNVLTLKMDVLFGPTKLHVFRQFREYYPFELFGTGFSEQSRMRIIRFSRDKPIQTLKCITDHVVKTCSAEWRHNVPDARSAIPTNSEKLETHKILWAGVICMRTLKVVYNSHELDGTWLECMVRNEKLNRTVSYRLQIKWNGNRQIPQIALDTPTTPNVALNCESEKDGYLKNKDRVTCTCKTEVSRAVAFQSLPGLVNRKEGFSPLSIEFVVRQEFNDRALVCFDDISNQLIEKYKLKVAFGPTSASIATTYGEIQENEKTHEKTFSAVSGLRYTLTCTSDSVRPAPQIQWEHSLNIDDGVEEGYVVEQKDADGGGKIYSNVLTFHPRLADGGNAIKCHVRNPKTDVSITDTVELKITVFENQESLIMWAVAAVGVFLLVSYPLCLWRYRMKKQQQREQAATPATDNAFAGPAAPGTESKPQTNDTTRTRMATMLDTAPGSRRGSNESAVSQYGFLRAEAPREDSITLTNILRD